VSARFVVECGDGICLQLKRDATGKPRVTPDGSFLALDDGLVWKTVPFAIDLGDRLG